MHLMIPYEIVIHNEIKPKLINIFKENIHSYMYILSLYNVRQLEVWDIYYDIVGHTYLQISTRSIHGQAT